MAIQDMICYGPFELFFKFTTRPWTATQRGTVRLRLPPIRLGVLLKVCMNTGPRGFNDTRAVADLARDGYARSLQYTKVRIRNSLRHRLPIWFCAHSLGRGLSVWHRLPRWFCAHLLGRGLSGWHRLSIWFCAHLLGRELSGRRRVFVHKE